MSLLRRHKYVLVALMVYWPALFIATHIPVPDLARQSGMSDKTMHYLAYLGLVFLWWPAISPYKKVDWRKAKVWITLAVMVWYGATDEWLQGYIVGRSADVMDFFSDLTGTIAGLIILSVFSFWSAALIVSAIFIFTISNLSKIDMLWQLPHINTAFHFLAYTFFTLVWIQYTQRYMPVSFDRKFKWLAVACAMPVCLLAIVKLFSVAFGKHVWIIDCLTAITGIFVAVLVSFLTCRYGPSNRRKNLSTA